MYINTYHVWLSLLILKHLKIHDRTKNKCWLTVVGMRVGCDDYWSNEYNREYERADVMQTTHICMLGGE
jgi:hypothetical protein